MTTEAFLSQLQNLGIQLWADGERLRYDAPKGVLETVLVLTKEDVRI